MKILFLSKRRPQKKDLWYRPYGRFFHIPRILAERGHDVCLLLLSHQREPQSRKIQYGMTWISESVLPAGLFSYIRLAKKTLKEFRPDWIVGFSDTYYGILAVSLGKKYEIGSVIDAYDNYESYIPWIKPLHHFWRKAIRKATMVTAAGPNLARFMASFRQDKKASVIPMAADPEFYPMDRTTCRQKLGLSLGKKIVGYCGSLYRNRGIEVMFQAFEILRSQCKDLEIVFTGRRERGVSMPEGFRHFGYVPDNVMPFFINAMDVLVIINRTSNFGSFSYPAKLYEGISCRIPVVATKTGPARWITGYREQFLARPEDPTDLAAKIQTLLSLDRADYGEPTTWERSSNLFESALLAKSDCTEY